MSTQSSQSQDSGDEAEVRSLYAHLLDCWNRRDADGFAALFAGDGNTVGFDGSMLNGRSEIASTLRTIFADHPTASYISIVRDVRFPVAEAAIVRAVAGMVPRGGSDINPATNAIQTLVAARHEGKWMVEIFQNTPAQFHGRPELARQLTDELRAMI
jgi:uncharacterized protein (TIGR02246 family)